SDRPSAATTSGPAATATSIRSMAGTLARGRGPSRPRWRRQAPPGGHAHEGAGVAHRGPARVVVEVDEDVGPAGPRPGVVDPVEPRGQRAAAVGRPGRG